MTEAQNAAIQLEEGDGRGRYVLDLGGGSKAELTFGRERDGSMVVDHTFVPPRFRGKGIAAKLVERVVADAEKAGTKIVPLCPFVAAEFRRRPEWSALRAR